MVSKASKFYPALMKKTNILLGILCTITPLYGQNLTSFNQERLLLLQIGLAVLGGWGLLNLLVNLILYPKAKGSKKYFYQLNLVFGVSNVLFAAIALAILNRQQASSFGLEDSLIELFKFEKLLLFNMGLNISYLVSGLFLLKLAKVQLEKASRFRGYGRTMLLQGAWYCLYDLTFFLFHSHLWDFSKLLAM